MRVLLFIIVMISSVGFAQQDKHTVAKTSAEKWMLNRLDNETTTYKLISFSELEEVKKESPDAKSAMDSVTKLNYSYFNEMSSKKTTADFNNYEAQIKEFKELKTALKNQNTIVIGYKLVHKFSTKDEDDFKVNYTCTYIFNKDLKIQETALRKNVDRDSGDY